MLTWIIRWMLQNLLKMNHRLLTVSVLVGGVFWEFGCREKNNFLLQKLIAEGRLISKDVGDANALDVR